MDCPLWCVQRVGNRQVYMPSLCGRCRQGNVQLIQWLFDLTHSPSHQSRLGPSGTLVIPVCPQLHIWSRSSFCRHPARRAIRFCFRRGHLTPRCVLTQLLNFSLPPVLWRTVFSVFRTLAQVLSPFRTCVVVLTRIRLSPFAIDRIYVVWLALSTLPAVFRLATVLPAVGALPIESVTSSW